MSMDPFDDDEEAETKEKKKKYDEFLLAEYSSIAQSYSNTISTIATFFRSYLVIVGLPIPILGFVLTQLSKPPTTGQANPIAIPSELTFFVPLIACGIWLLGFCLMLYVVNLRLDALLYAHTVNGIRRFFYDKSNLEYADELKIRVLPRTPTQPRYYEWTYFFAVVIVFSLLNTIYPITGIAWYLVHEYHGSPDPFWFIVSVAAFSFPFHIGAYYWVVRFRESKYLRKFIIGVDLDGVLNKHRDTFCTKLWELLGKTVWADQITTIPVHYRPELGVTEADEQAIFNHPSYWKDLAPTEGAAEVISKLRNVFGYEVLIFTHRPWPEPKQIAAAQRQDYRAAWEGLRFWRPRRPQNQADYRTWWGRTKSWFSLVVPTIRTIFSPMGAGAVQVLTRKWLGLHGIGYDRLIIERGNVYTAGPNLRYWNRFTIAERREIRIFVEDDLYKAIKLANVCEIVFLINHPYNQIDTLPRNVLRVNGWKDIYEFIRQKL